MEFDAIMSGFALGDFPLAKKACIGKAIALYFSRSVLRRVHFILFSNLVNIE